ncbi:MmcQ/YjbR family DNA-binding protein [Devosia sp. SL43]|uniref:MmcQ/YjbR family DNA-binding protein n=1 Tax=Devosia sp. SL43 TaxID=2806348 RepID=UPI001F183CFB|nr:MmcQ/YjbR family DNA-binding protein [Devosia sp. SL43]UJW84670.1 MmcQ/YjbR family DNA-binding protein [Devosia sp. SL43]
MPRIDSFVTTRIHMVDYPAVMTRTGFESFVLALPKATLVRQWRDDSVAKVGGKIFALLDRDPGEVWLKVSDIAYELLTELPGIRPAPYFARAGWVAISVASPLSEDEVEAYLREAHRLVAGKLSWKVRAELGL